MHDTESSLGIIEWKKRGKDSLLLTIVFGILNSVQINKEVEIYLFQMRYGVIHFSNLIIPKTWRNFGGIWHTCLWL